jgi:hypothetical protein
LKQKISERARARGGGGAAPNKHIGAVPKTTESEKIETKPIKTGNENKSKKKVAKAKNILPRHK